MRVLLIALLAAISYAQTDVDFHAFAVSQGLNLNNTQGFDGVTELLEENEDGDTNIMGAGPIVTIIIGFAFGATFAFLSWMLIFSPRSFSTLRLSLNLRGSDSASTITQSSSREKVGSKRRVRFRYDVPKPITSLKHLVPSPVEIRGDIPLDHDASRRFIISRLKQFAADQGAMNSPDGNGECHVPKLKSSAINGEFHVPKRKSSNDSDTSSCLSVKLEVACNVRDRPADFYTRSYSRPRSLSLNDSSTNEEYGGILYE